MNIRLMKNKSADNTTNKILTTITLFEGGKLRNETSVINPTIRFEGNIEDYAECNYFYIPKFKRYYFVTDIRSIRTGIFDISGHCDVLTTAYKLGNLNKCGGIIKKQQNKWNLYLNDGSFKVYQNPIVTTELFPNGFTNFQYVLAVAGSSQS